MCHVKKNIASGVTYRTQRGQERKDGIVPIVQGTKGLSFSYLQARRALALCSNVQFVYSALHETLYFILKLASAVSLRAHGSEPPLLKWFRYP